MHYLLIGSSVGLTIFINGCDKDIDYNVNSKWIYINETEHIITYEPNSVWNEFNILGKDTFVYIQEGEGSKYIEANDFVPPINAKVFIDNEKFDSILTKKIRDISEYENKKIADRNFEFTFRFTNQNISDYHE